MNAMKNMSKSELARRHLSTDGQPKPRKSRTAAKGNQIKSGKGPDAEEPEE